MRHGIDRSNSTVAGSFPIGTAAPECHSSNSPAGPSPAASGGQFSLAKLLPQARFFSGSDVVFDSIAGSAATATPGQLVVYRIGQDCPAELVAAAMARGAAGILTEQLLPCPLPQCIVGDADLALAKISANQLGSPDRKLLTVGVIGSAGKTTTTLLAASLLRGSGIRVAYQCDLGQSDGVVQSTSSDPVPGGGELIQWIGEAVDCQCRAAVIEVDEESLRRGRLDAIHFDLLIVTGRSEFSDDYGPSGLHCALDRLTRDGVVIAPGDDVKAARVIRDSGARMVTYGVRKRADVTAKIIDQSGGMMTLLVTHQDTTAVMETNLCGAAMAANHAAATMLGLLIAQPLEQIVETLGQLREIPGRRQRLESYGHAAVVVDAGGSPQRVADALRTHRSMKSAGRLWCVLAASVEDDDSCLAEYGHLMERFADHAVVTAGPQSKSAFLSLSHGILDGTERCADFRLVADRRRAIEWVIHQSRENDTILVITGQRGQTAAEQRADLQRITSWVDLARQHRSDSRQPETVNLKVVG